MNEPRFWNDELDRVPFCNTLIQRYNEIKNEILTFIKTKQPLRDYPQFSYVNPQNQQQESRLYENYWKAFPLSTFHEDFVELSKDSLGYDLAAYAEWTKSQCPVTYGIIRDLEQQGNLANTFVSRLEPASYIKPHFGWCFTYLRIQLGLVCDPQCEITVGDETQTWHEGKLLAFKDGGAFPHSVRHNGTRERVILSVDLRLIYLKKFIPHIF
ncbi:MAG TPA: aspartyl/asparaginyl beta-hydroxylase domain-containing protein [Acidobacteriota bacterium]|nr:aspartyl/asparaginyl beta-hydroxylase domain-containing protein [Acidobacteriota bacterium]